MHTHKHCLHTTLKYCNICDVAYCANCGKEWGQNNWYYNYPYTITWGGYDATSSAITTTAVHSHS